MREFKPPYQFLTHPKANCLVIPLVIIFCVGCKTVPVKREIKAVSEIATISPSHKYIKAHMKDGTVYILHDWNFDKIANTLSGYGSLLDVNRNTISTEAKLKSNAVNEPFRIHIADISLLETNYTGRSIAGGLTIVSGITLGFAIVCVLNPKACFGSCPTFYAHDGDTLVIQAEGFSTSISPALEKNDIDMLYTAKPTKDFELVVTNEALETHSIRYANLLAFEKRDDERVFASPDGVFYKSSGVIKPMQCQNQEGSCLDKVLEVDGHEVFSLSDRDNLDSKEEIFLTYELGKNSNVGLVIGKRQSLLTTFLMYQGLAYMGNSVAYWMAQSERVKAAHRKGILELLGGIEVFSKDAQGNWKLVGTVNETGPIATDFNIIPITDDQRGKLELKLRLNRGLWRIDYLGLANISGEVVPTVVQPFQVETVTGEEPDPLGKLVNDTGYLVTYPGDAYRIKYRLPFENAELFLDSRGYYLEWIREEWVKEQNFQKLHQMTRRPSQYLKNAARQYKSLEPQMEETFWNSRYVKK